MTKAPFVLCIAVCLGFSSIFISNPSGRCQELSLPPVDTTVIRFLNYIPIACLSLCPVSLLCDRDSRSTGFVCYSPAKVTTTPASICCTSLPLCQDLAVRLGCGSIHTYALQHPVFLPTSACLYSLSLL